MDTTPNSSQPRAHWGSRMSFVLAAVGSAIGLGNLWKFPYIAGVNGGGAFVLVYLLCIALVGIPIFIAELYIGQESQANTVRSFEVLHKKGSWWSLPGWMGLISAFLILSFYSVVSGWILDFEYRSIMGEFFNQDDKSIQGALGSLLSNPLRQSLWLLAFVFLTVAIVWKGVQQGLERWNKILMPSLFCMLIGLLIYSFTLEGFGEAFNFLFSWDTSKLSPSGLLEAVGHSFFTLSLGMGVIIVYGSYLSKSENLPRVAVTVALLDTLVALVAGLIIFSIVFTFGLEPSSGPGLIFSTLPALFVQIPGGYFLSIIFFLLVIFAALTSAISLLEVATAYVSETYHIHRKKVLITIGTLIYLFGLLSVFSFNKLSDFKISLIPGREGLTFFDLFDTLTSSYLLPIGGLLLSLFFGWKLGKKAVAKMTNEHSFLTPWVLWSVRVVAPLAILIILARTIYKLLVESP